jgi:hypothetical protein
LKQLFVLVLLLISSNVFSQNIKKVDFSKIKRVSLVYADTAQGLESSFGHIGIRLSVGDKNSISDISAEFVADTTSSTSGIEMYIRGSGLVNPFPVIIQYDFFENYKLNKSINENRRLEIVELDLTPEQLQKFLSFMDDFQNGVISQEYYFLTANCSEIPINALSIAIGEKISWSNVPYKVIGVVKEMPLTKAITLAKNASTKRLDITDRYILQNSYTKHFVNESWNHNFLEDMASPHFETRRLSYLKILWLKNKNVIPKSTFRRLYLKYKKIELGYDKYLFKSILDPKQLHYKKLNVVTFDMPKNIRRNSVKAELKIINDKAVVQVKYKLKNGKKISSFIKYDAEVTGLVFDKKMNKIFFNNDLIGRLINTGSNRLILQKGLSIHFEQVKNEINMLMYSDTKTSKTNLSIDEIKSLGHLSLRNTDKNLNNGIGACYALTLIQQAFNERAIFSHAKENKLNSKELIVLIDKLVHGHFVVFQGFDNISDLTKSLDKKLFINFVNAIQTENNGSVIEAFWSNLTEREQLTKKNLNSALSLLEEGYSFPLHLAFMTKGKDAKLASNKGHVIYLHKLTPNGDGSYQVLAYDPNLGTDEFYILKENEQGILTLKLTQKTSLIMNVGELEIWPIIDKLDNNRIELTNIIKSVDLNRKKIDKLDSKVVPLSEIYTILK